MTENGSSAPTIVASATESRVRGGRIGVIATCVLAGLVALGTLASSGAAGATNTWEGVWNTDFGEMTLDAGGSGHYEGFTPGTVSGNVSGNVNQGTWHDDVQDPGDNTDNGTFTFTMGADGKSFTGEWAYDGGGCGTGCGWNGTCIEGACLQNGSGGGLPPGGCDTGGGFGRAKPRCDKKTVSEPAPGESAKVGSKLAKGTDKAVVDVTTSSPGSLATTPLVGEGSAEDKKGTQGEQIAACWLLGPGALVTDPAAVANILRDYDEALAREFKRFDAGRGTAEGTLGFCRLFVEILVAVQAENPPPARRAAASGCAQQLVFNGDSKHGKLKLKLAEPKALPKSAARYSCAETGADELELTAKSSSKGGLTGELGKKLDLGVVVPPDATPTGATLTFGFAS